MCFDEFLESRNDVDISNHESQRCMERSVNECRSGQ
jgi:hypothetical protein